MLFHALPAKSTGIAYIAAASSTAARLDNTLVPEHRQSLTKRNSRNAHLCCELDLRRKLVSVIYEAHGQRRLQLIDNAIR